VCFFNARGSLLQTLERSLRVSPISRSKCADLISALELSALKHRPRHLGLAPKRGTPAFCFLWRKYSESTARIFRPEHPATLKPAGSRGSTVNRPLFRSGILSTLRWERDGTRLGNGRKTEKELKHDLQNDDLSIRYGARCPPCPCEDLPWSNLDALRILNQRAGDGPA
jgi:hypothetical protein